MSKLEKELKGVAKELGGGGHGTGKKGTGKKKKSTKGGSSLEKKAKRLLK